MILVYLGSWSYGRFKDENNTFYKMKTDLTFGTWQEDIWCPIIIILLCTSDVVEHLRKSPTYELVGSGQVLNVVTRVTQLTWGKLLKQPDWDEWQASELLQLDQYDSQGMFGYPVIVDSEAAVFHSVWVYASKAVDGWK